MAILYFGLTYIAWGQQSGRLKLIGFAVISLIAGLGNGLILGAHWARSFNRH